MPAAALPKAIRDEVARLGSADIMVGIPSFKNAATIGYVVRAAQAGLVQYFPDLRPVLVNADAGSPDGTQRVVVETEPPDYVERILLIRPTQQAAAHFSLTYPEVDGVGGKGAALRTIFQIAAALKVEALVVVDSDLRSIVPEWIELLAGPIQKGGFDFVAPLYSRYKYDGTITNTVTYPMTRALYGLRIRQPIGGDFGVSGDLVRHYLEQDDWDADVSQVRHRHLDDDQGDHRRLCGLPDPTWGEGARPQGPGRRPGTDVQPGRRHDPAPDRPARRPLAGRDAARTTSRSTASSASSTRRRSRSTRTGCSRSSPRGAQCRRRMADGPRRLDNFRGSTKALVDDAERRARGENAFHFPDELWARVIYDIGLAWHARARAPRPAGCVADTAVLRKSREPDLRDDGPHDRPGGGIRRAPGARFRANQAVFVDRWKRPRPRPSGRTRRRPEAAAQRPTAAPRTQRADDCATAAADPASRSRTRGRRPI